ncbi:MAG: aminotransferase class IV [Verrucomicrobiota bacterium]
MLPEQEARIGITEPGVVYGEGCFETLKVTKGRPRFFEDHWQRFTNSTSAVGIRIEASKESVFQQAIELALRNGIQSGVLRISCHQLFEGASLLVQATPPRRHPLPKSFQVQFSNWQHPGLSPHSSIKHNNYARFRAAFREAIEAGYDEALLLDARGHVIEGAVSNLFWVDASGQLNSPSLNAGALPGIIRNKLIGLFPAIIECEPSKDLLLQAREIFLANSLLEIMPVAQLEDYPLPACPGEITQKVIESFYDAYPETDN